MWHKKLCYPKCRPGVWQDFRLTPWLVWHGLLDFFGIFCIFIAPFGVRRGLKMIVSHRAPSSLNMSSYRAIWTHLKPNFIFFGKTISDQEKSKLFLKFKSPHLAILINIWHICQDPGTKILVLRSWYQHPGTQILVPRYWYQDPGTQILD